MQADQHRGETDPAGGNPALAEIQQVVVRHKGKQGEHRERKHFKEDWVDTGNLFTGV